MAVDLASTAQVLSPKQGGDITFEDMVDEREAMGESQIQKLFTGSTVFLTGGTGFLGKLLADKLCRSHYIILSLLACASSMREVSSAHSVMAHIHDLWSVLIWTVLPRIFLSIGLRGSCPDVKRIYVLVRPKKNKESTKRLQEQFDDVLYDKLKKEYPDFMQKLSVVEGDVGQIGLGIKEEDRKRLCEEVEIIFHGAATVRFDEPLKSAVEINVRGTREMLLLARGCSKLKAMVHISTAYSNCVSNTIDEKFYESAVHGDKLIDLVETLDEKIINNITPGILGDFPNTYAFTKLAAESIVQQYSKGLPVALFRPAIVIGTAKEPVAGWIDNVYGPTGVVVGAAVGLLHVLHCKPSAVADLVPGDMVVNACIACAWKTAKDCPRNYEDAPPPDLPPPVYNFVSSVQKPLTWEKFMYFNEVYGLEVPTVQAIYYYVFSLINSKTLYRIYCLLMHWIPAYIVDTIFKLIGKKPMLIKAYTKIEKFSEVISYFAIREWKFNNDNTQRLFNELCDADKHIFDFDISVLDWSEYFNSYVRGIRVYLLKDPVETVPQGKAKHHRLKYTHYFITTVLALIFLRLLWGIFRLVLGF